MAKPERGKSQGENYGRKNRENEEARNLGRIAEKGIGAKHLLGRSREK